jgi:AraC family transcriptional regulator
MKPQSEAIAASLEFIESHLCAPLTVGHIAEAAGYSLFHFIRTFNRVVRHTPYDYLMRRRLSHAAVLLLETEALVLDIALDCQFETHEGFTRAFGRMFGVPPTTWREGGFRDRRCLMPALEPADLAFRQQVGGLIPKIIHLEPLTLVGWMSLMGPEVANADYFSALFKQSLEVELDLVGGKGLWEVHTLPISQSQRDLIFIGEAVEDQQLPVDRFVTKNLPEGDYLFLPLKDPIQDRTPGERFLFHTFLPGSGLRISEPLVIFRSGKNPGLLMPVDKAK